MKRILGVIGLALLAPGAALAQCGFQNEVPVTSLSAGFEAWKVVTDKMAECGNFKAELDQEFREKQVAAMAANPSQYTIGGVANATLVPLQDCVKLLAKSTFSRILPV